MHLHFLLRVGHQHSIHKIGNFDISSLIDVNTFRVEIQVRYSSFSQLCYNEAQLLDNPLFFSQISFRTLFHPFIKIDTIAVIVNDVNTCGRFHHFDRFCDIWMFETFEKRGFVKKTIVKPIVLVIFQLDFLQCVEFSLLYMLCFDDFVHVLNFSYCIEEFVILDHFLFAHFDAKMMETEIRYQQSWLGQIKVYNTRTKAVVFYQQKIQFFENILDMTMQVNITTQYLHSIIDENEELRLKVGKLQQIQKYMEALLKRCEQLQIEKEQIIQDHKILRQNNEKLIKELNSIHQTHRQEIKMVLIQHDCIMRQMQQELKIIRTQHQRQAQMSERLRQGKNLCENQLRQLQEKFRAFSKEADKQIAQLRQSLINNQKEYQILVEQSNMNKSEHLQEKQDLMKELYHLKAVVGRQMKRRIEEIQTENFALKKQADGLRKYNQEIARNATLREKQLVQQVKSLKSQNQLKEKALNDRVKALQLQISEKSIQSQNRLHEINSFTQQNLHLQKQVQVSLLNQNKLCYMLEQTQKQNQDLRLKLIEIDKYFQEETQRYKSEFFQQRNHNTELRKVLNDKELLLNQKLREIKDLLNIVDEIQSSLKIKDKEIALLKNQLDALETQIKTNIKNFEEKSLQCRQLDEKNRSLKVSLQQLQAINVGLKKQILQSQTTNHSLKRQLLNPRIANKENQEKLQLMIQNFRRERQILLFEHIQEKEKLKETHQFQIRQKELEYLRKIQYFQQEIQRLK